MIRPAGYGRRLVAFSGLLNLRRGRCEGLIKSATFTKVPLRSNFLPPGRVAEEKIAPGQET